VAEKKKKQEEAEVANGADSETAPAAEPKKKGGIAGAIVTPLIVGAASFGTVFLLPTQNAPLASESHSAATTAPLTPHDFMPKNLDVVELKEFIVSIRDGKNILRMSLALEVPNEVRGEVNPNELRLRDAFMGYLRAVEVSELQDPDFLPQLRAQLLRRSRLVLGQDKVAGILITDFLIR